MAKKIVITSEETNNELSVFINVNNKMTLLVESESDYYPAVFCFDDIEDVQDTIILLQNAIKYYKLITE